ncbi:phosphatase PAP2 family protein [Pseudarthrobacter sp. NPDC080037]|uniref:phosphatase PAP2 family protein n=1 Tax=Pseudarthrobacter sp. NPDC080037 TaxID=3155289 RepID=UPI00344FC25C
MWLFAATIWVGFVLTVTGQPEPGSGTSGSLDPGKVDVLLTVSEGIHYLLGPFGATTIVLVICVYLLLLKRRPVQSLAFASIVVVGWVASTLAKVLVARPRPATASTNGFITETGNNSFPSGHTAFAAALVLAVALVLCRSTVEQVTALGVGGLFVGCVAFSRVYLGLHYVSDVVASLAVVIAATMAWIPLWNVVIAPRLPAPPPVVPAARRTGAARPGSTKRALRTPPGL